MLRGIFDAACNSVSVEEPIAGGGIAPPAYRVVGHLRYDSSG
jgi:hypothetical protein